MTRTELVKKAKAFATQTLNNNAIVGDAEYNGLSKLPEDQAISELAHTFLDDAARQLQ